MKTMRPVRLVFTREESIISTAKRHPSRTTLRMGLMTRRPHPRAGNAHGLRRRRLWAVDRRRDAQGGDPRRRALRHPERLQVDTYGIYTNNTPSGAFRSFGALQTQFATESHLDICAERLGLDPFEIRRINAMRDGADDPHQAEARLGQPDACARCG